MHPLYEVVRRNLPRGDKGAVDAAETAELLTQVWQSAQGARPQVKVSAEAFGKHLARGLAGKADVRRELAEFHPADLYLAVGCAEGEPLALAAFRGEILPRARRAIAKIRSGQDFIEDVEDRLVQKLLISRPGRQARIADYGGRGTLASWVCVAAVRTAIEVARLKSPRQVPLESTRLSASVAAGRPDLELIRRAHGADFKAALEEAFGRLSSEERNLLRLSVLEGVGIDKLAGIFAAHRSTVARRLQRVRKQLFDDTRRALSRRLGVRGPDLDSLMRAVQSQLQLSLSHLFSAERQR